MNKKEEKECAVCYEKLTTKDKPLKECGHHIHKLCILKSGKNKCPMCRCTIKLNKKDMDCCKKYSLQMDINECKNNNPILQNYSEDELIQLLQYIWTI